VTKWSGEIYVDKISNEGNEDPFVFNDPWLYSFCHASQLRRQVWKDSYLQIGSTIIFASGQQADNSILSVDTIFLIGDIRKWTPKPNLQLPTLFEKHYKSKSSDLWKRHFNFPFVGQHDSVTHTYTAELWDEAKEKFSYLPLDSNGEKVSIPFNKLSTLLSNKIERKVKGKYPVLLSDNEIKNTLKAINDGTLTKVLRNIKVITLKPSSNKVKC